MYPSISNSLRLAMSYLGNMEDERCFLKICNNLINLAFGIGWVLISSHGCKNVSTIIFHLRH
jgi:hypothetical protein